MCCDWPAGKSARATFGKYGLTGLRFRQYHHASCVNQILGTLQAPSFTRLDEIQWTRKTRIRYQQPIAGAPFLYLKLHFVRARVHHHADVAVTEARAAQTVRQGLAGRGKIGLRSRAPIPADVFAPVLAARDRGVRLAEPDH